MSWWQKWLSTLLYEVSYREGVSVSVGFEDGSLTDSAQLPAANDTRAWLTNELFAATHSVPFAELPLCRLLRR